MWRISESLQSGKLFLIATVLFLVLFVSLVEALPANVTLNAPLNNTFFFNQNQSFNCSFTDNDAVNNLTLLLFNVTGGVMVQNSTSPGTANGSFNFSVTIPYEAKIQWNCRANDTGGNVSFAPLNFSARYDITLPTAKMVSPANNTVSGLTPIQLSCNYADSLGLKNGSIRVQNSSAVVNTFNSIMGDITSSGHSVNFNPPRNGTYTWYCQAYDWVGNFFQNTSLYTLIYDSNAPNITLISPANNSQGYSFIQDFTCSVKLPSNASSLSNLTVFVWNSTGQQVNTSTALYNDGYQNTSTFSIGLPYFNVYTWNCKGFNNVSISSVAPNNFTFNLNTSIPTVNLLFPPNNNISYITNQTFNCSALDTGQLSNLTLQIWNSSSMIHSTTNSITGNSNQSNFSYEFPRFDTYLWNCQAYNIEGRSASAILNYTLTITQNPLTIAVGNVTVTNATHSAIMRMVYARYPYVFRNQNTTIVFNITEDITGNNSLLITDALFYFTIIGTNYSIAYNPYYQGYALQILFTYNDTFIQVPFLAHAIKTNYTINDISGSFIVSNYSMVHIKLFTDSSLSRKYKNDKGFIFAIRSNSDLDRIRHQQERIFEPIDVFNVWGQRVFDINLTSINRYPSAVIWGSYVNGEATIGLPANQDYNFVFTTGQYLFTNIYEDAPYYITKDNELFLGKAYITQPEVTLAYRVTPWALKWWTVLIRYFLVFGLFFLTFVIMVLAYKQTGDITLILKYLVGSALFFPLFNLILILILH